MNLNDVLSEQLIDLNILADTKHDVLHVLSQRLFDHGCINDVEQFLADVYQREQQGETGLGSHIAIPHGKSDAVIKTSIAIGKTSHDIEWESLDGEPVNFIILFAVRMVDKTTTHIKLLAQVSELLADDELLERLVSVKSKREIFNLFEIVKEEQPV